MMECPALGSVAWTGNPIRDKLRKAQSCQEPQEKVSN